MASTSRDFYSRRPDTPKPAALFNRHSLLAIAEESTVRDLDLEQRLVELSGFFDTFFYVASAGLEALADPIRHYLTIGWEIGIEPRADFPGTFLLPYYRTLGLVEPPLVTWLTLRSGGGFTPYLLHEIRDAASAAQTTGLFDADFYNAQFGGLPEDLDPATHYAVLGEAIGLPASGDFSARYYRDRYQDLAGADYFLLHHYVRYGREERRHAKPLNKHRFGDAEFQPEKPNVLMVVHETTRTGAPILGWNVAKVLAKSYNVHSIYLGGGDLTNEFEKISTHILGVLNHADRHEVDLDPALSGLLGSCDFLYAIVNSAESRSVVELLARRYIPSLLLVHEFGAYVYPHTTFRSALDWASDVVFPARIVADAAAEVHPVVRLRRQHIVPQGASALPPPPKQKKADGSKDLPEKKGYGKNLKTLTRLHEEDGLFIVLGAGTVHLRKGVELFIAAAAEVARTPPARKVHFLWVGHGYNPKQDMGYSMYLQQQVNRSGVADSISFLDAVTDLDSVYRIADAFFLCSRLDPLPNVSIDAALLGIPLVCFRNASGTAELLADDPVASLGISDHLNAEDAGKFIVRLAGDEVLHRAMSDATRHFASTRFAMSSYVENLDRIGTEAKARLKQQQADAETLLQDATFNQDMFLGTADIAETREHTVARYLTLGAARTWKPITIAETSLRRPAPGFNPRLYAQAFPDTLLGQPDPLADFIRRGKPAGPWQVQVLEPAGIAPAQYAARSLKIALHAHFYYPDMAQDLLAHLRSNQTDCDLFLTTDEEDKAEELENSLKTYRRGLVEIQVVPNRGRNFGPLLTGVAERLASYDVIGHVHSKRSVGKPGEWDKGNEWREFLWQNLLGGQYPMLDRIAAAFEQQQELGLVFPSDPHFVGWDENLQVAQELARRLGWAGQLPPSLDFPLGSMFWARRRALQPLFNARFEWDDYPEEPLPDDGTLLHALERLVPLICCDISGFRYAVTHVPGISWNS